VDWYRNTKDLEKSAASIIRSDYKHLKSEFLNRRAAARYRALASIIPGRERFSWDLSF